MQTHNFSEVKTGSIGGTPKISGQSHPQAGFQVKPTIYNVNKIYEERLSFGQRLADNIAATMGSWRFIIIQSGLLAGWLSLNTLGWVTHWDSYPFILLNLALSFQAAYAAPIIMMSQNRQAEKDRLSAQNDYDVNKLGELEIQAILLHLEEQDRFLLELLRRTEVAGNKCEEQIDANVADLISVRPVKPLNKAHRQQIENELWDTVKAGLAQQNLSPSDVRNLIGHCHAIVNMHFFQRNTTVDPSSAIDEHQLNILGILYREVFISVGANYEHPEADDLIEVNSLLLERMKYRGVDSELIAKHSEISKLLIEKLLENQKV